MFKLQKPFVILLLTAIVSGITSGDLQAYDVEQWSILDGQKGAILSSAFSADGQYLACGDAYGEIWLWSMQTGKRVDKFRGHAGGVRSVDYNPNGWYIASAGQDGSVRIWSILSGKEISAFIGFKAAASAVAFSPDGKILAAAGDDGRIIVWSMESGLEQANKVSNYSSIGCIAFSPDGSQLAVGGAGGISIYNTADWDYEFSIPMTSHWVNGMAFSKDGLKLVTGAGITGNAGTALNRNEILLDVMGRSGGAYGGAMSGNVSLWDLNSEDLDWSYSNPYGAVRSVDISPDGQTVGYGTTNNIVGYLAASGGYSIGYQTNGHTADVYSVRFSPYGGILASSSADMTSSVWWLKSDDPVRGLPPDLYAQLEFSDENGNGVLEALETAELTITITNKGKGAAQRLQVSINDGSPDKDLYIGNGLIYKLDAGKSESIVVPIASGIKLKSKEHRLQINVAEHFGFDMDPAYLVLSTQEYKEPQLAYSGIEIIDTGEGTFARVADGLLQSGEQVKAKVVVQNVGKGRAIHTSYLVEKDDDNIYMDNARGYLGVLEPGEVDTIWLSISPNKRVETTGALPIYLTMTEYTGKGNLKEYQLPILLNQKPPEVNIVEVQPDMDQMNRQIARFEYQSSKFTTRVSEVENVWSIEQSRTKRKNSTAVVIGVENYLSLPPAPYAASDADLMKEYFKKALGVEQVVLFKNEEVSGLFFDDTFNPDYGELQRTIIPNQTELFVYYSGHGLPAKDGSSTYLFPFDGRIERLDKQGYSLDAFYKNLASLGAKKTTVILDACFSGASRTSSKFQTENLVAHKAIGLKIKEPWHNYPGFNVINSSSGSETSLGYDQSGTGLFTYYFTLGLKGAADANNDRKITLGELENYVVSNVVTTSKKIVGLQTPQFNGDKNYVLVEW